MIRHAWKLTARDRRIQQWQCPRCGTVKTMHSNYEGWPTVTYVTMAQSRSRRVPLCIAQTEQALGTLIPVSHPRSDEP